MGPGAGSRRDRVLTRPSPASEPGAVGHAIAVIEDLDQGSSRDPGGYCDPDATVLAAFHNGLPRSEPRSVPLAVVSSNPLAERTFLGTGNGLFRKTGR